MSEDQAPNGTAKHQELFDNLKIAIFDSSFNYKLLENLKLHLADLIEFHSTPDLSEDMQKEAEELTHLLAQLTKFFLDFQKRLMVTPLEEKPQLTRIK